MRKRKKARKLKRGPKFRYKERRTFPTIPSFLFFLSSFLFFLLHFPSLMDHCNAKVVVDGVKDDCPCTRMIPPTETTSGPVLCRDCRHMESAHPVAKISGHTLVSSLIDKVKLQRDEAQTTQSGDSSTVKVKVEATEAEARRETNAGFKGKGKAAVDQETAKKSGSGRGGDTKYDAGAGGSGPGRTGPGRAPWRSWGGSSRSAGRPRPPSGPPAR